MPKKNKKTAGAAALQQQREEMEQAIAQELADAQAGPGFFEWDTEEIGRWLRDTDWSGSGTPEDALQTVEDEEV